VTARAKRIGRIFIGTSGYNYNHWKGTLYPETVSASKMLSIYAAVFPTVEINYTFYHVPQEKTLQNWRSRVKPDFLFVLKASKQITHNKKLAEVEDDLGVFCQRARILGDQLGCILFQLPPSLHKDLGRLRSFLTLLPEDLRHAVEFRHDSWCDDSVFRLLEKHGVAYCIVSAPQLKTYFRATADFAYLRFHGSTQWYSYNYSEAELADWAQQIRAFSQDGRDVYAFFNNDYRAYAPQNALKLIRLIER
jgi:uncharacterized protein YecE (DUF72 family)